MPDHLYILFCENPIDPKTVEPDFELELNAAEKAGFQSLLFDFDDFCAGNILRSLRKIKPSTDLKSVIYRGWMLNPNQYATLYESLSRNNYFLINSPQQYQNCHYLPDSLKFIDQKTPLTIYNPLATIEDMDSLINKAKVFGNRPVVIKDYVKSEKHHWETACFAKDASNTSELSAIIANFVNLRGAFLNEGIVIREFVDLNELATHSKSGMPINEEYRLFYYKNELVDMFNYWEEGEYPVEKPNTQEFEQIARDIDSNFFTMDIAKKKNNQFIIIELGDGQVAGLPDQADILKFYTKLMVMNHEL